MNILDAIKHPQLFGCLPVFADMSSWVRWIVFLKAVYGLPLDNGELAIFLHHTGRTTYAPPFGGWQEIICIVGRQSGKTRLAATIAVFEAITAKQEPDGTDLYAIVVAQDQRAALRALLSYAKAPFEMIPAFAAEVENQTADMLRLKNGVVLSAYPCRPAAVRGIRARVALCDELAFFRSTENMPQDTEMLRALRPALATTGGKLIVLSSPYGQAGTLWELHRANYGRDDATVLVWQGTAPEMNPTLPADYLARMAQDDPEAYRSEVLGEFRSGVATFLDLDTLQACVAEGIKEVLPLSGKHYSAFCDPSGGRRDKFTLAVAHAEGEKVVLDALRAWTPPFNPGEVIREASALLKTYRVHQVHGDRYSGEFVVEQFRHHGINYVASERDRSAIYLDLLPLVNSQRAVFLDQPDLLRELRGLERRRGSSGRDRVDHRPGAHDDLSNSAAGALTLVAGPQLKPRIRSLASDGPAPRIFYQPGPLERHVREGELWT
ncbi:MAG: terminase family protein [Nitrospirota bacterium]|nr:terminase family protein [Nitrospirota bacterium]